MTRTELQREYERICRDWISNEIRSAEDLDVLLHNYRILFAYNSNVIENPQTTIHDTREIFENGKVINYTGDLRTLFEIENQKICYDYLKDYIIRREPLSPELICSIHKKLMAKCYDESRYQRVSDRAPLRFMTILQVTVSGHFRKTSRGKYLSFAGRSMILTAAAQMC